RVGEIDKSAFLFRPVRHERPYVLELLALPEAPDRLQLGAAAGDALQDSSERRQGVTANVEVGPRHGHVRIERAILRREVAIRDTCEFALLLLGPQPQRWRREREQTGDAFALDQDGDVAPFAQ